MLNYKFIFMQHFKFKLLFSLIMFCTFHSFSQSFQGPIKVFLDCSNFGGDCYNDYVRQELTIVNFVRDRLDADVHIIAKNNQNSIGTQINTFFVVGRNHFQYHSDTLNYTVPLNSTESEIRNLWVKNIKLALIPYLAKTASVDEIEINIRKKDVKEIDTTLKQSDPYNFWVFQIGLSGSYDGNQVYKSAEGNGYLFADRETNDSKTNLYINANEQFSKYDDNGTIYKYEYQVFNVGGDYVKKINQHVAYGGGIDYTNSIFSNLKSQFTIGPKIEYSVFPYKDFNTKRFVFQYGVDVRNNIYYDTTIYLKTKELFSAQYLSAIVSSTQTWGSINVGAFWRNLLNDWKKNSLSFNGAITTRLVKGLNFALWGNYNFVRNQINIRKGDASIDQLLAKNREILSAYQFNIGIGLSYRFGSKFNSAVNPAFNGLNYNINL